MNAFRLRPARTLAELEAYSVPRHPAPVDLVLDGNEGPPPPAEALLAEVARRGPELLRRYPSTRTLEEALAQRHGIAPERVLVTAGGDEALDRLCRVLLAPGRNMVLAVPSFVMIPHYVALTGAALREVPWQGGTYPIADVLQAVDENTAIVGCVSPNNPTGAVATRGDLRRLATEAPQTLVLLDHAYAEFANEDLTDDALRFDNTLVLRTFSKARGLAGLRVGYVLGSPELLRAMRAAGGPYSVSSVSLALAEAALLHETPSERAYVERVRSERTALRTQIQELGGQASPSQANFVFARFADAVWVQDGLAGLGIGVRRFGDRPGLEGRLRITCPGNEHEHARLARALDAVLRPQAVLFDVDGVLVDVSHSYRRAIIETADTFGVTLEPVDVSRAKAAGNANNDWVVTQRLLAERGIEASLEDVTERFEALYQGTPTRPGLRVHERLLAPPGWLAELAQRFPLALVTGRPRRDVESFLRDSETVGCFRAVVAMEDAPLKPDPRPVQLALERLGVERAWMIGDTPDDVRAARGAGVVPLAIPSPDASCAATPGAALYAAGAARVLNRIEDLADLLP